MNQTNITPVANDIANNALLRVVFIQAGWHRDIVEKGRQAFVETMSQGGYSSQRIDIVDVPGSLEIPLTAKRLASTGRYEAIVAAGFVVDGGIYSHQYVASAVIEGLMRVQLEADVPILSMVLTPQTFHGHAEHVDFFKTHFQTKGEEAAQACLEVLALSKRLAG